MFIRNCSYLFLRYLVFFSIRIVYSIFPFKKRDASPCKVIIETRSFVFVFNKNLYFF